jgi:multiple sugar transport system substrate-binding protein
MGWDTALRELTRLSIHKSKSGLHVSQIAAPWIDDFVSFRALRSFSDKEIDAIGGASGFLPAAWKTVHMPWGKEVWAIPWLADLRVIYYWRDMLEQAHIDEETAFQTPKHLENTLGRLQAEVIETPWVVAARDPFATLQNAVSWVWANEGDIVSDDGRRVLFSQPKAYDGFRAYFSLCRYMPRGIQKLNHRLTINMFALRQAAIAMGPCGWYWQIRDRSNSPDLLDRLGVALPPGPAYVGGSNLVIWQHAYQEADDALELVQFLTNQKTQVDYCPRIGHLPVRLDALTRPPYSTDPHYQIMVETLRSGRSYPVFPKWETVEEKLNDAFMWFWDSLEADPDQDLDNLIQSYLGSLAGRLAVTLRARI